MAKRTTVKRFDTDEVQGEGSYVVLSSLKVKEIRHLRNADKAKDNDFDAFDEGCKLLAQHIVDWNWVDDEDQPLPLPKGKVSVIDMLTNEESEFLSDLMTGTDTKNASE